jgi:hypothetical protein
MSLEIILLVVLMCPHFILQAVHKAVVPPLGGPFSTSKNLYGLASARSLISCLAVATTSLEIIL